MVELLKERQNIFYQQAFLPIQNGKISHAYFIETNGNDDKTVYSYLMLFIENIFLQKELPISKEKLHHLLETKSYPDLIEIYPVNNVIKKEQILSLMEQFKTKSVYNGYQIYIIYNADKLNSYAANTILKFLEEPEQNIIAVLIGSNRYQILNTILSRCQILSIKPEINIDNITFSDEIKKICNDICFEHNDLLIHFNFYFENLFKTKELAVENLDQIRKYFQILFDQQLNKQNTSIKLTKIEILQIISIIEKSYKKLNYNINLKLWLDEFLLQLTEVNYENC